MKRTLLLICTLLCANVLLAQTTFTIGDLTYYITSSVQPYKVQVSDCNTSATTVDIPETVTYNNKTYAVTSIGQAAFYECSRLTSVNIPNSVTSIIGGYYSNHGAFSECTSLTTITIPESVTSIGGCVFCGCINLTTLNFNAININSFEKRYYCTNRYEYQYALSGSYITTINIGENVERIPAHFAKNANHLSEVNISNSVTSIGDSAFWGMNGLTSIVLPNSIDSIGENAFNGCSNLTSITCNSDVAPVLGTNVFNNTPSNKELIVSICNIDNYSSSNWSNYFNNIKGGNMGVLYKKDGLNNLSVVGTYENVNPLIIPSNVSCGNTSFNVTSIDDSAFYGRNDLTSISLPNTITSIGNHAFNGCSGLMIFAIPENVSSIGEYAFNGCSGLNFVTIPNTITSISNSTFRNCSNLISVTIPNSVVSINDNAFNGCSTLMSITIPENVSSIGIGSFGNCSSLSSIIFNATNCSVTNSSFNLSPISSIVIGNNVEIIPNNFAYGNTLLTSITIPNGVSTIGNSSFYGCSNLTSITIPYSVSTIENSAFYGCNGLREVNIGNNVSSIGSFAFGSCSSLEKVKCLSSNPATLIDITAFPYPNNAKLKVPCGSVNNYISSSLWNILFNNRISDYYSVEAVANNSSYGNVEIENNCETFITTLTAIPNNCHQFISWNDGNTNNPRIISVTKDTSFTAIFEKIEFNTEISATICEGQVYTENGFNVNEEGVHILNLNAINGCDSIVTLTLNVNPVIYTDLNVTMCEGEILNFSGFNVSESGVYTQVLTAVNGCDSVVTLTVTTNPIYNTNLTATICEGETFNLSGFVENEAGVYTQTLQTVNGCDSIVTLTLNVNPTFNTELSANICQGQVYTENGFNVSEAGTYTQTHTAANGCDSIVTLVVTTYPTFDTTITATINAGEMYSEFGFNESEAGTYVQNLQTEFGCDSTITLVLSVNSSLLDIEQTEITFYPNPTNSEITFSQAIEKVEVIDLTGKTILTFTNAKTINLESLPSGAYYLRLTNDEKTIMQKVIKQ